MIFKKAKFFIYALLYGIQGMYKYIWGPENTFPAVYHVSVHIWPYNRPLCIMSKIPGNYCILTKILIFRKMAGSVQTHDI